MIFQMIMTSAVVPAMCAIATGMIVWNKTRSEMCVLVSAITMMLLSQEVLGMLFTISYRLEFILNQLYRMH